jgi:hypothetical protein
MSNLPLTEKVLSILGWGRQSVFVVLFSVALFATEFDGYELDVTSSLTHRLLSVSAGLKVNEKISEEVYHDSVRFQRSFPVPGPFSG